jgi:uncharacterized repeat protein (TIGR01451 family)
MNCIKRLVGSWGLAGASLLAAVGAQAVPVLVIDNPATVGVLDVIVVDNAPAGTPSALGVSTLGDANAVAGFVQSLTPVGNFTSNISIGISKPALGAPASPHMDLNVSTTSTGAGGTLTIILGDDGFTGSPAAARLSIGGTTQGTVTAARAFFDNGNQAGAQTTPIAALGPFPAGPYGVSATQVIAPGGTYALTEVVTITHGSGTRRTGFDAELRLLPTCLDLQKEISVDGGSTWFDADTPDAAVMAPAPADASYRLTVTNCGPANAGENNTLTNISVSDADLGIAGHPLADLPAGSSVVLTPAELPALAVAGRCTDPGFVTNVASVDATSVATGLPVNDSDPAVLQCKGTPALQIVKEISLDGVTFHDANTDVEALLATAPSDAVYRITVRNAGTTTLTDLTVDDDELGVHVALADLGIAALAPGEQAVLAAGDVPALSVSGRCASAGTIINVAEAHGTDPTTGVVVMDDDPAVLVCVAAPAIEIVKEVSVDGGSTWSDAATQTIPGGALYRITVRNIGARDLVNVNVVDADLGIDEVVASLPVGGEVVLTQAEIPALSVPGLCVREELKTNVATVHAVTADVLADPVSSSDTANVRCVGSPAVAIVKEVSVDGGATYHDADADNDPSTPTVEPPADALYRIRVTNIGTAALENLLVTDVQLAITVDLSTLVPPVLELAPGESVVLDEGNVGGLATPGRCTSAGTFINMAHVDATAVATGEAVDAVDPATLICEEPQIAIDIRKQAEGPDVRTFLAGAEVTYEVSVTNTGTATLSNVVVGDPLLPACDRAVGTLAPGDVFTYECTLPEASVGFDNEACVDAERVKEDGTPTGRTVHDCDTSEIVVDQPAALGDFVWEDLDNDGQQDANEPGVADVTVKLLDAGGNVVATQQTGANGEYLFTDLAPGTYSVMFVAPAGYMFSTADQGDDATDSDANTGNGMTGPYTLASGETNRTVDAGLFRKAALGDFVWEDLDNDGQQDANEPGVPDVTVKLLDAGGDVVATQQTDANGGYLFTDLAPGTYSVMFVAPAGRTLTTANAGDDASDSDADAGNGMTGPYTLASGETNRTVDAGLVAPAAIDIEKLVKVVGDGVLEGLTPGYWKQPQHFGAWVGVSPSDSYESVFMVDDPDDPTLLEALSRGGGGYKALGRHAVAALLNINNPNINYALDFATLKAAVQSAYATGNFEPLKNQLDAENNRGADLTTPAGVPVGDGADADEPTGPIGAVGVSFMFTFVVTNPGGVELAGVNVLDDGAGVVAPFAPTPVLDGGFNVGDTDQDGRLDPGESWQYASMLSSATLAAGQYVNVATVTGTPVDAAGTPVGPAVSDADPAYWKVLDDEPALAALGDFVWEDLDSDGQQDANEPGVANVTVKLLDAGGNVVATQQTGANGEYLFTDLVPGTYSVMFVAPAGRTITTANAGDDASDSDADAGNGMTGPYTLASGETNRTVDAGLVAENPRIDIRKQVEGPDLRQVPPGTLVPFEITVTNTGDAGLTNVLVTDPLLPGCNRTIGSLAVGASTSYTCSVVVGGAASLMVVDKFDTVSYGNNDGTQQWSGDWTENDPLGGAQIPSEGNVLVGWSALVLDDKPDTGAMPSARRSVNLTGMTSATLKFDFKTTHGVDPSDKAVVEISRDGVNFDVLHTFTGISGEKVGWKMFDISAWISADTTVRFRIADYYGADAEMFKVTYVKITAEGPAMPGFTNEACASGEGAGRTVSDCDTSTVTVQPQVPGIDIRKQTEGDDSRTVAPGLVPFEITVTNSGSVALTGVVVDDPLVPACDRNVGDLAAGASTTYTCSVQVGGGSAMTWLDVFGAQSYANNDGDTAWAGPWVEVDGAGAGPSSGNVRIYSGKLKLTNQGSYATKPMITRPVNLTGKASATLSFDFWTTDGVDANDSVLVQVSADGVNFTTLETFAGTGGASDGHRSYDITPYISPATAIRFKVWDYYGGTDEYFKVDNVKIVANGGLGNFTNVACASGSAAGQPVSDCDPSSVVVGHASVDIRKNAEGPDRFTVEAGVPAEFEIVVTNSGDFDLENVAVTDPKVAACATVIGNLAVGESVTHTCSVTGVGGAVMSFIDRFATASYGNNDGDSSFAGPWVEEDGQGGGATGGNVMVANGRLSLDDNPDTGANPSVRRRADIAGKSTAVLSFDWATAAGVDTTDTLMVQVSADGVNFTTLETFRGISGAKTGRRTFDISRFASANTTVRFKIWENFGGADEQFLVDNVTIAAFADGFTNEACVSGTGGGVTVGDCDTSTVETPQSLCVGSAVSDATCHAGGSTHAVWLPGIGTDFRFMPDAGSFREFADGTATLTGVVRLAADPDRAFTVDVTLSGLTANPPAGSPKLELASGAYVVNGGPVDPSQWRYYTAFSGTLTGLGDYDGAVLAIQRVGPAFQVGNGANGKNYNFGASSWFTWTVVSQPVSGTTLQVTGQGDFNLDLGADCLLPPVPGPMTFKDRFNSVSYSNNDGDANFAGPWIETDPLGGGASGGNVRVYDGKLKLTNDGGYTTKPMVSRKAALAGKSQATLSFRFWTTAGVDASDSVVVQVSANGETFTTLATIGGIAGATDQARSYDISSYLTDNTTVRFKVWDYYSGADEYFKVDDLMIVAK